MVVVPYKLDVGTSGRSGSILQSQLCQYRNGREGPDTQPAIPFISISMVSSVLNALACP